MGWFFHYQEDGKESPWLLAMSSDRAKIVAERGPKFTTVLDLSSVPTDNDWTKVRYQGPYYVDFDADGDIELACEQVKAFLGKLDGELGFDVTQARYYASGGKGFHVEIPEACFMPKVPPTGTAWLPYIYRNISESLYIETLDLKVYTGKRGRMWRTPNVQRDDGMYKVPLSLDEVMGMTPDLYAELIKEPREVDPPSPPTLNSKFAMLYSVAKDKVTSHMRGKKKRQEKANAFLDPWKKAKKHPPSIERIMRGEGLADGVGFQSIAMQLSIYATSVGMTQDEFLERSRGLCENHVSDSRRYNSLKKRQAELIRMYEYMGENSLYDFEIGPIVRLLPAGSAAPDLGFVETEDSEDTPPAQRVETTDVEDGDHPASTPETTVDSHTSMRRGFFMNKDGMFVRRGDNVDSVCRATLRSVEAMVDVDNWNDRQFRGYEFDLVTSGRAKRRVMLGAESFTSAQRLKQFFMAHQLSFQGGDAEAAALLDIMSEKAMRHGEVFVYPREGFFVIGNPNTSVNDLVKCYLTQHHFMSSLSEDDPNYFRLRYRPVNATSGYHIDIHNAPKLNISMRPHIENFFRWNKPEVLGDLIGWFVASHYRSLYMACFNQFPCLHIWGDAGTGKTKSVELLASMHWFDRNRISVKTATASSPFSLDVDASTSTSAPMIIDEWKPRELKAQKGKYEKLKDIIKGSYTGADIGSRGTVNRSAAESSLGVVRSKSTAPVVYIAEHIESETALFERSVVVNLRSSYKTGERLSAWENLYESVDGRAAVSALGREIVEWGFAINMETFRNELIAIRSQLQASIPKTDQGQSTVADRTVQNRAITLHGLTILRRILQGVFGDHFNHIVDDLIGSRSEALVGEEGLITKVQSMPEIAKVINRMALMSRSADEAFELISGKDYINEGTWVEIKLETCYDKYRRYCAQIHDAPLFDNLEALGFSMNGFNAVIDSLCPTSELREYPTERIFRLDVGKMIRSGLQSFRD